MRLLLGGLVLGRCEVRLVLLGGGGGAGGLCGWVCAHCVVNSVNAVSVRHGPTPSSSPS